MKPLKFLMDKDPVLAIGLMSGTSADGMDAALVRIKGWGLGTRVEQLSFVSLPYEPQVRSAILRLAGARAAGRTSSASFTSCWESSPWRRACACARRPG